MESSRKHARESEEAGDNIESLSRSISPPRKKSRATSIKKSPWQLTWIRDQPEANNQDTVTLKDILGDPLISECWEFNYLHNIPFLMDAFDPDTKDFTSVHVVHGFWKQEDPNRLDLFEQASQFPNVTLHSAPMPEMFGTHHSKMMVLFRRDDTAQVIIHTANMIPKDWTNMTNGVWKSPILPKLPSTESSTDSNGTIGSGHRFKKDFLNYLRCYNSHRNICRSMIDELSKYDFSTVKGALIASVPGRHKISDSDDGTAWGWQGLQRCLRQVPSVDGESEVVVQVSSIATLGAKDDWLQNTLFGSLASKKGTGIKRPRFKVVFPCPSEIRRSLDGYSSGGSIHTKIQSAQQKAQLEYLRPLFHHWANDCISGPSISKEENKADSGRNRAAPHIKTYIRYNDKGHIDWGLLTSANLSKQAWGDAKKPTGEVRVSSWEIGVLVWPELFGEDTIMKPAFKSDLAKPDEVSQDDAGKQSTISLRIPYSLPLQRHGAEEVPWVATMSHSEPDWLYNVW